MKGISHLKSLRLQLSLALFSLLVASSAFAVHIPKISGYIDYGFTYNTAAAGAVVMICTTPVPEPYQCIGPRADANGYYQYSNWNVADGAYLYFFPYLDHGNPPYGRTGMWGSDTVPVHVSKACKTRDQWGNCKNFGLSFSHFIYPSPLKPMAVNPAPGETDVILTQTMKWTNSSDYWRVNTGITYDIYGSGYGSELLLQVADLQCNADSNNHCQWELPITLDPQTPYNWKIVAKTNYGYTTESEVYHFSTGW
jgi:hypothetical protein